MLKVKWRVLGYQPIRRVWTIRGEYDDVESAAIQRHAIIASGLRARVVCIKKCTKQIKPAVYNDTRKFREQQSMAMSDRADAKKHYKSPG